MAISGFQQINVGLPNESANSDSLYAAFNKVNNNFTNLFNLSSQYTTFTAGNGISVTANANTGIVTITNTGVTSLTAGTGVSLSGSNGAITISANAGNGNGGITSVGLLSSTINVSGSPLVTNGNLTINLPTTGVTAGTYTYPTISVDQYGRISNIANANNVGTVTSVGLTAGAGISVTGGPITSNGNITVTNTGVTRLSAGTGISLSGSNGNVTISAPSTGGTVTSVGISSSTLTVGSSPVTSFGNITVELPSSITIPGTLSSGNLTATQRVVFNGNEDLLNGAAANLQVTATYFSTSGSETGTLADGLSGQIKTFMMLADGGDMVITVANAAWGGAGTMTFGDVGDGCTLQYVANKWFCIGNNGVVFA